MRIRFNVSGVVQGVGFRPFIYRIASKNGLTGYVQNKGDAGVVILVEGDAQNIKKFSFDLTNQLPPLAKIDSITKKELPNKNEYIQFTIIQSSKEIEHSGSVIPADIAICNQCLRELRAPANPRYNYFFITCTDCGPRFTIIKQLPYDRENTTMNEFPLCSFCQQEYTDPTNRRFHAETVACPICGPKAYLTTADGQIVDVHNPIREAGRLLSEGNILSVKGYGGFHIAASTTLEKPLLRLREIKHRKEKPFAIMAKNLDSAKTFSEINSKEGQLLTSPQRPIVLLSKSNDYNLSALVAPNLHNIGVMLPYTGLHYMIFDNIPDLSLVMTSANPPNQPIVKDNKEAIKTLGTTVDYFLMHNRKIAHRCDDSVMRVHSNQQVFLRRSRGYAPEPIRIKQKAQHCVLGLGGELNNTSCILYEDKAFISQHIGDVENIETLSFLKEATKHLQNLTNTHPEAIACDLHPKFTTTQIAQEISHTKKLPLTRVQHHYAHAAALMTEYGLNDIVAITCDGYGYGLDGGAWGGEVLYTNINSPTFERLAHLEHQQLLGGDLASRYPLRLAAAMLQNAAIDVNGWLKKRSGNLPHGDIEVELILTQLENKNNVILTTSCGRVLDAVSALLGVCEARSYEGEPAIKLESAAIGGKDVLQLKPEIESNVLGTSYLLRCIYENLNKFSAPDLAYSAHVYIAKGLAELAIEQAQAKGTKNVGFTGGTSCNQILTQHIRKAIEDVGFRFYVNQVIPPGDGGVSFGQAVVASFNSF